MALKQSVYADAATPGWATVKQGSETILAFWGYSVIAVSQDPKGPGSKVVLRDGTKNGAVLWYEVHAPVDHILSAVAAAQALYEAQISKRAA